MAKKPSEALNAEDIAAANLGFQLAQIAIDLLIKKGVVTREEILAVFKDAHAYYAAPGNPDRAEIRASAAEVLQKLIRTKYDIPDKSQQH